jgi:hypothetical protein
LLREHEENMRKLMDNFQEDQLRWES